MKIAVIGGGAAGITAALFAAKNEANVTILEHKDRIGIKIRQTGNGKCNFSNESVTVNDYDTDNPQKLSEMLSCFTSQDAIDFFNSCGLLCKSKNGGLYPYNEQATSVLEVLMYQLREWGVCIKTNVTVNQISIDRNSHKFNIDVNSKILSFDRVIIACGGKCAANTGSDGSGYQLLKSLSIPVTELVPSLTGLRAEGTFWKQLSGIRAHCNITLYSNNTKIANEQGELQITDYGLSGIPIFQLSSKAARSILDGKRTKVMIDFLPDIRNESLLELISNKMKLSNTYNSEEFLVGTFHKKLIPLFLKQNNISPSTPSTHVSMEQWKRVFHLAKAFEVTVKESNGFQQAQVTSGGVPLSEISSRCELLSIPGCFVIGELLNVDGRCGGYNLHFAWTSGKIAGTYASSSEKSVEQ